MPLLCWNYWMFVKRKWTWSVCP